VESKDELLKGTLKNVYLGKRELLDEEKELKT